MPTRRVVHCEQLEALALRTSQPSPQPSARAATSNLATPHSSVVALSSSWSADLFGASQEHNPQPEAVEARREVCQAGPRRG